MNPNYNLLINVALHLTNMSVSKKWVGPSVDEKSYQPH